ncbi:MAG: DUF4163 domain-containing protein [Ignavibacteriae bacterium]|nr:DUF4163 domain-containing protein [Ignavibacteriota bacterium]
MKSTITLIVLFLMVLISRNSFSQNDYKIEKYFKSLEACPDSSKDWEEMVCTYVRIEYPVFLNSQFSSKLNQLTKSLIHSFFFERYYNSFDDYSEQFFQDYWKDQLELHTSIWSTDIFVNIIWNSDKLISLAAESYHFTGGAHGWGRTRTLNYNKEFNRVIFLSDIFDLYPDCKSKLNRIFNERLNDERKKIGKNKQIDEIDFFEASNYSYDDINKRFLIDKDSLVILLDYYDEMEGSRIGASISGFKIPFSLLSHLIKKDCPLNFK